MAHHTSSRTARTRCLDIMLQRITTTDTHEGTADYLYYLQEQLLQMKRETPPNEHEGIDQAITRIKDTAFQLKEHLIFKEHSHSDLLHRHDLALRLDIIQQKKNQPLYARPPEQELHERIRAYERHQDLTRTHFSRHPGKIIIPLQPPKPSSSPLAAVFNSFEYGLHARAIERAFGGKMHMYKNIPYIALTVDHADEERVIKELKKNREKYNIPMSKAYFDIRPSRIIIHPEVGKRLTLARKQERLWNLDQIGAYTAHQATQGNGITVGIIDTGIDYLHEQLYDRIDRTHPGWNFVDNNNEVMDKEGHGTHVAGTIAGKTVGVAPLAQLKSYVVLDENGSGTEADCLAGLDQCITDNVDIVNLSLGSTFDNYAFEDLCKIAYQNGILVVAAAGNDGNSDYNYPAAYTGVSSVAALDQEKRWLDFSNYNDANDFAAPGGDILSSVPGGYAYLSGTSMASPHVAGSFALVRSLFKADMESMDILMKTTTEQLPYSHEQVGYGLIRPDHALQSLGFSRGEPHERKLHPALCH